MSSFRDRFLTPGVARVITSPSAILAAGAGAAVGIVALGPAGALAGVVTYAARVLAAVPRAPKRPGINPRALDQPWRSAVEEVLDARRRFEIAVGRVAPGPLSERLGDLGRRLDVAVDESWRIASAGNALSAGRSQIDTRRIAAELQSAEAAPRTSRSEQTIAAIRAQLASATRLDDTISDTHDRLHLLDARIDETVTRTVELSVTQADVSSLGGIDAEIDSIVLDMEALRQAIEETSGRGAEAEQRRFGSAP